MLPWIFARVRLPSENGKGVVLSEDNRRQLWISPGFAHGFLVPLEVADVEYKCTNYYDPADEGALWWSDPTVNIQWPLECEPILSQKDRDGVLLQAL